MKTIKSYTAPVSLALVTALLAACGGGGSSATNTAALGAADTSATVSGTITGFGSVVVDGQEYAESTTTAYASDAAGSEQKIGADALQLGQQVDLKLDANGNILKVVATPEVEGNVTSTTGSVSINGAATPALVVSGASIVANADSAQGPVTSYGGGYTQFSDVQVSDLVEVHGVLRSSNGVGYIQATNISKDQAFQGARLTGTVSNYNSALQTFTLGSITVNASSATVNPTGATLSNGEVVSAWSKSAISGGTLTAAGIKVHKHVGVAGNIVGISGPVSSYVSQASFVVDGLTVDASAVALPADVAALSNGLMVAVHGTINSAGVLVADKLRVFDSKVNVAPPVFLQGSISNYVSNSSFTVRGVTVDATNATINSTVTGVTGAPSAVTTLANGNFVLIKGKLQNNVVVASAVQVIAMPTSAVIDVVATVQNYDASTGLLSVNLNVPGRDTSTSVSTTLGNNVTFNNGSATQLVAGQAVNIHALATLNGDGTPSISVQSITILPSVPATGGVTRPVRLGGVISAVTTDTNGTVTSFTVRNLTVAVTGTTQVQGASTLKVGEPVAVAAAAGANNSLTATTVVVLPLREGSGPLPAAGSGPMPTVGSGI